jgi:hypothetical protein
MFFRVFLGFGRSLTAWTNFRVASMSISIAAYRVVNFIEEFATRGKRLRNEKEK